MQQFVNAIQTVENIELLLDPSPQILTTPNTIARVRRQAIDMNDNSLFLGRREMTAIAAATIIEAFQPVLIVAAHPVLKAAPADAER
jgi:hypothetical protein